MMPVYTLLTPLVLAMNLQASADTLTADQVLARCAASYEAAKSYQGMLVIVTDIGGRHETMTLSVKAENDDKGKVARSASTMTHTSAGKGGNRSSTQKQIDNGTTVLSVRPDLKQYSKGLHAPESLADPFRQEFAEVTESGVKLAVSETTLKGKPVYKLSSKIPDGEVVILIDKQTYHFQSLRKWRAPKGDKSSLEMTVSNQIFNQPIPTSTFEWSIPAGYVEVGSKGSASITGAHAAEAIARPERPIVLRLPELSEVQGDCTVVTSTSKFDSSDAKEGPIGNPRRAS